MRIIATVSLLLVCASSIVYAFWQQELKYAMPTPIPRAYTPVLLKTRVFVPPIIKGPVFLHFFNPDCPCSRFNQKHVNQLIFRHQKDVQFKVVIPPYASLEAARSFFDHDVEIIVDTVGLAKSCGVYSTPQAVIIDSQSNLYFRGNYNRTRYCTDPNTNYAERALRAFVEGLPLPAEALNEFAQKAYGCSFDEE